LLLLAGEKLKMNSWQNSWQQEKSTFGNTFDSPTPYACQEFLTCYNRINRKEGVRMVKDIQEGNFTSSQKQLSF